MKYPPIHFEPGKHAYGVNRIDVIENLERGQGEPASFWTEDDIARIAKKPTDVIGIDSLMMYGYIKEGENGLPELINREEFRGWLPGTIEDITSGKDSLLVVAGDIVQFTASPTYSTLPRLGILAALGLGAGAAVANRYSTAQSIRSNHNTESKLSRRAFIGGLSALAGMVALPAADIFVSHEATTDDGTMTELAQLIVRYDATQNMQFLGKDDSIRIVIDGRTAMVAQKTAEATLRHDIAQGTVLFGNGHLPGSEVAIDQDQRDEAIVNFAQDYYKINYDDYASGKFGTLDDLERIVYEDISKSAVVKAYELDVELWRREPARAVRESLEIVELHQSDYIKHLLDRRLELNSR